jgi:large subunit ribosomal protein L37Ae
MATKKVGSAGRFGARYGRKVRHRVSAIEKKQKKWHKCPYCGKERVKRIFIGIWGCRACGAKFTGKAYVPK